MYGERKKNERRKNCLFHSTWMRSEKKRVWLGAVFNPTKMMKKKNWFLCRLFLTFQMSHFWAANQVKWPTTSNTSSYVIELCWKFVCLFFLLETLVTFSLLNLNLIINRNYSNYGYFYDKLSSNKSAVRFAFFRYQKINRFAENFTLIFKQYPTKNQLKIANDLMSFV